MHFILTVFRISSISTLTFWKSDTIDDFCTTEIVAKTAVSYSKQVHKLFVFIRYDYNKNLFQNVLKS